MVHRKSTKAQKAALVVILTLANCYFIFTSIPHADQQVGGKSSRLVESTTTIDTSFKFANKSPEKQLTPVVAMPDVSNNTVNLHLELGRWDASRKFKIHDNVIVGDRFVELSRELDVTLATQSSFDRLHWLAKSLKTWSGAVSVAVFVPDIELDAALLYITSLRKCSPPLRQQVAFHFLYPADKPPVRWKLKDPNHWNSLSCNNTDHQLNYLFKSKNFASRSFQNWRAEYPYPQNHLRNVARKNSQSSYVFLADIDIMPCPQMAAKLYKFLNSNTCTKCAFVIATYEVKANVRSFPQTKKELKNLSASNRARPFHQSVFAINQRAVNITRYEMEPEAVDGVTHVSHVAKYEPLFEPFYVSLDTVPPHDERFIGYGYTRNTQVYEMNKSGWEFHVLSPLYAVHWGFQERRDQPAFRDRQVKRNEVKYLAFKREMAAKYPPYPSSIRKPPS